MSDLISRQAAIDIFDDYNISVENGDLEAYCRDRKRLCELPPIQPKRGKWLYQIGMVKCDQCLRAIRRIDHDGLLNFCPNCGADMRGDKDDQR